MLRAFGTPDAPTLVVAAGQATPYGMGAVDANGVVWLFGEPSGWDDVEFDTPVDEVPGSNGALIGPATVRHKTLDFEGTIIAPSPAEAGPALARLRQVVARPGQWVTFHKEDFGTVWWVRGVPSGRFRPVRVAAQAWRVQFQIECDQPWKFGWPQHCQAMNLPTVATATGRTYPRTYPLTYGAVVGPVGGQITAVNAGDADAWPLLTWAGAVTNPWVEIDATHRVAPLFSQGASQTTILDMQRMTLVTDGVHRPLSLAAGSVPWPIPSGAHTIRWNHSGSYSPTPTLTVCWYDTGS